MKYLLAIFTSLSCLCLHAEPATTVQPKEDLLNFDNNDTLHGTFLGLGELGTLIWKSKESPNPITFETKAIRKIVFRCGVGAPAFSHSSYITLSNGDVLPCKIDSLDSKKAAITTDYAGKLVIERDDIAAIDLQPLGYQLSYHGPFSNEGWEITQPDNVAKNQNNTPDVETQSWEHANFSWYNNGGLGAIIQRKVNLPDSYRIRFNLESQRYTNIALILNADFKTPAAKADDQQNAQPGGGIRPEKSMQAFGTCLVLRITSHSPHILYNYYDENGTFFSMPLNPIVAGSPISLESQSPDQELEFRVSRAKKHIAFYQNGQFISQWQLRDLPHFPAGNGFGFASLYLGKNLLTRISDITIAPWHSILDPALSLQNEDRDIVMLANGTDRYSGTVNRIDSGTLSLDGAFSKMSIPSVDVQSIHFASKLLAKVSEPTPDHIAFRFYDRGKLTAKLTGKDADKFKVHHPILGHITLHPRYLTAIDFRNTDSLLDAWNKKL